MIMYFKLAWYLKTPFVFLLDKRYKLIDRKTIKTLSKQIQNKYVSDYFDCDDFAWVFKALASRRKENGVGFAVGWIKGTPHAWNVALTDTGIYQVEPQSGYTFKKDKRYRVLAVII